MIEYQVRVSPGVVTYCKNAAELDRLIKDMVQREVDLSVVTITVARNTES